MKVCTSDHHFQSHLVLGSLNISYTIFFSKNKFQKVKKIQIFIVLPDDLGEVAVDVNYLAVGNPESKFQIFIC